MSARATEQTSNGMLAIGIDLGDRRSAYCVLGKDGEVMEEGAITSTPLSFEKHFLKYPHQGSRGSAARSAPASVPRLDEAVAESDLALVSLIMCAISPIRTRRVPNAAFFTSSSSQPGNAQRFPDLIWRIRCSVRGMLMRFLSVSGLAPYAIAECCCAVIHITARKACTARERRSQD
jgi:hypothetical protein